MNAYRCVSLEVKKYTLNFDFIGTEGFKCTEKVLFSTDQNQVRFDSKSIRVESVLLNDAPLKFSVDGGKRFLDVELPDSGEYEILITYSADFNKGLTGMYIAGRESREMITTDFEPDGASFAFPCFDRPDQKAIFSISARINDGSEAISNMPVESTASVEGGKLITFMDTPRMSTYLVYIGVGKFITKTITRGKGHITLAVPGQEMRSDDFPLEVASNCVDFYENYFGIPYQLPKMHLIAVPDFAAGAMENWGAITFREDALLHNENTDTDTTRMIAVTIAHEIAHQWFGNLVTMEWWNDLWLNESFATFMSSLCINKKYPEFEEVKTYYMEETVASMKLDCLPSTHAINVDVKTPDEIKEIFDEISYGKGGSILRMIHNYVGDESFRNGLKSYLTDFQFGNAKGTDLWTHIAKASGLPVDEVMDSWINQPGFPIVNGKYDGKILKLSQNRFLLGKDSSDGLWKVPLIIRAGDVEKNLLMEERNMEIEIENLTGLNANGSGYYLWRAEGISGPSSTGLTSLNRSDAVNNAYFSFLSGSLDFKSYSDLCMSICEDGDVPATTLCVRNTLFMESIVGDSDTFKAFSTNLCRTVSRSYESKPVMRPLEVITKNEMEYLRARTDSEFAMTKAKLFKNYFLLKPDERTVVALSKGLTVENMDEMAEAYRSASDDSDKYNIIEGMTAASGKKNHKFIMSMVQGSEIKQQDIPYAFLGLIRNRDARKFVLSNFETIVKMIEEAFGESGILSRVVSVCIPYLGIENEKKIIRKIDDIDQRKIGMGLKKGKELLETFKRIRTYVGQ